MLKITVRTEGMRLTIPVPHAALNIGCSILLSKVFQRHVYAGINQQLQKTEVDFISPQIDKKWLKPILKEMKSHKGLVLVDVVANDGTEVKVRL